MKQALFCAGAVLLAVAGVSYKMRQTEVAPMYAFELPRMFFQCVEFPMPKDGDTIPSWKFDQAVHMNFIDFKGVMFMPGNYNLGTGCGFVSPTTLARGIAKSITFGSDGRVVVEDYKVDPPR